MRDMIRTCATSVINNRQQVLVEDCRSLIFGPPSILLTRGFPTSPCFKGGDSWKAEGGLLLAWQPVAILCSSQEEKIISYFIWVSAITQGQAPLGSACLSLTDGPLPDITHSVRQPLILNITALALLFICYLNKPRFCPSQSQDIWLVNGMSLSQSSNPEMKEKWPQ